MQLRNMIYNLIISSCLLIPSLSWPMDNNLQIKELVIDEETIKPLPEPEEMKIEEEILPSQIEVKRAALPFSALSSSSKDLLSPLEETKQEKIEVEDVEEETIPFKVEFSYRVRFEPTKKLWRVVRDEIEAPYREKKRQQQQIEQLLRERDEKLKKKTAQSQPAEDIEQIKLRIAMEEERRFEKEQRAKEERLKETLEKERAERERAAQEKRLAEEEAKKLEERQSKKEKSEQKIGGFKSWLFGTKDRLSQRFWLPRRLKKSLPPENRGINTTPASNSSTDTSSLKPEDLAPAQAKLTSIDKKEKGKGDYPIVRLLAATRDRLSQKIWLPKFLTEKREKRQHPEQPQELDITQLLNRQLPLDSTLKINGRKTINLRTGNSYWGMGIDKANKNNPPPSMFTPGFKIDQQLTVKLQGTVREKIHIDVDYDDSKQNEPQRFIIKYVGSKEDVVKNVEFGDVPMAIPGTKFITYNRNLFGLKAEAQTDKFKFWTVASRTKGERKKIERTGQTIKKEVSREERYYDQQKYYQLPPEVTIVGVYLDDRNPDNDNPNTLVGTITAEMITKAGTITHLGGEYDLFKAIDNYTFDATTGILTFKTTLSDNWIVGVVFKDKQGTIYPSAARDNPQSPVHLLMIKAEGGNRHSPYELKNYYYLGQSSIEPSTELSLEIVDLSSRNYYDTNNNNKQDEQEVSYIRLFGLDNDPLDGKVDTKFIDYTHGLLYFPDTTPFNLQDTNSSLNPYWTNLNDQTRQSLSIIYNPPAEIKPEDKHKYSLKWSFPVKKKDYSLDYINIIEGSEQVYVNDRLLTKDTDYYINYDLGHISFKPHIRITDTTKIRVEFEYAPLISQTQKTTFGLRGEYKPDPNFSIGSTYLFEGGSKPGKAPQVTSPTSSFHVMDADIQLKLIPLMQKAFNWKKSPPIELNINGEVASSFREVNTFGMAMIDSMEGAKEGRGMNLHENAWQLASLPAGKRGFLYHRKDEGKGAATYHGERSGPYNKKEPVKKEAEDETAVDEQVLVLECDHMAQPGTKTYISIVQPISSTYQDFSDYTDLELWLKDNTFNSIQELYLDVGVVSEKADNDAILDNEDENKNGLPDGNEKAKGWRFDHADGTYTLVGKDNDSFDSEDIDRDGELRQEEFYYTFRVAELTQRGSSGQLTAGAEPGWCSYLIPLNKGLGITSNNFNQPDWTRIKHLRIRVEGTSTYPNPTIYIGNISFVKNRWRRGESSGATNTTFNVSSVNSEEDTAYQSISLIKDASGYKDYYERLHGDNAKKEESLALSYSLPGRRVEGSNTITSLGYTSKVVGSDKNPHNYNDYGQLRFFLYNKRESGSPTLFFRFGNDDNNYFAYHQPLDFSDWNLVKVNLERFKELMVANKGTSGYNLKDGSYEVKGNPFFDNIRQFKVGVINEGDVSAIGQVYLNEIHLAEARSVNGAARRVEISSKYKNYLSMTMSEELLDGQYESPTRASSKDNSRIYDLRVDFTKFNFLPLNYEWRSTNKTMNPLEGKNAIDKELGYDDSKHQKITAGLRNIKWVANLDINSELSRDQSYVRRSKQTDKTTEIFSSGVKYKYTLPKKLFRLIPTGQSLTFSPSYHHNETRVVDVDYQDKALTGTENTRQQGGDMKIDFQPCKSISGSSLLKLDQTRKRINKANISQNDLIYFLTNRTINLSLDRLTCSWIAAAPLRLDAKFDYKEDYLAATSTLSRTKNLVTGSHIGFELPLSPNQWFNQWGISSTQTQTLNSRISKANPLRYLTSFNPKYNLDVNANYEQVDAKLDTLETMKRVWKDYHQGQVVNPRITTDQDAQIDGSTRTKRSFAENKRSYSLQTQWKICEPLTTSSFNYTYTRQHSQDKSTIKSNLSNEYNLNLQLDLPRALPRYAQLLSQSYIKTNYTWSQSKVSAQPEEITTSSELTPSLFWQRSPSTTRTTTFNLAGRYKRVDKPKNLMDKILTITPELKLNQTISKPKPINLPFGKVITFQRKLTTETVIKLNYSKQTENNKLTDHKANFSFELTGNYELQKNVKGSLSGKLGYQKDLRVRDNDYWGYETGFRLEFSF